MVMLGEAARCGTVERGRHTGNRYVVPVNILSSDMSGNRNKTSGKVTVTEMRQEGASGIKDKGQLCITSWTK